MRTPKPFSSLSRMSQFTVANVAGRLARLQGLYAVLREMGIGHGVSSCILLQAGEMGCVSPGGAGVLAPLDVVGHWPPAATPEVQAAGQ